MSDFLNTFMAVFTGTTGIYAIPVVIYMIGLCGILRKSGIRPWWAFVPCVRDFMLARCAGRIKEGRALLVLEVILIVMRLVGKYIVIGKFALSVAAVILALILIQLIFLIRIISGLVKVYGRSRWWIPLFVFGSFIATPIWGFSRAFQPKVQADSLQKQELEAEIKESMRHTWWTDFVYSLRRSTDYFMFKGDWKSLPIAVAITAIVASIARTDFFYTMEGTIKGSLALTCIAIWNGSFNSIQTISREKKKLREMKKDGMHISSFLVSTMIYQIMLCLLQTFLTMYTCSLIGMDFPDEGVIITSSMVEIGVTMFLITLAADMVCLTISALVRDTVAAMTVMPFVLVIQLVFSGSVINVSVWSDTISKYTISNYGVKCIAAQADYNNNPMVMAWDILVDLRESRVGTVINIGESMDRLQDESIPGIAAIRATDVGKVFTIGEVREMVDSSDAINAFLDKDLGIDLTVGEIIDMLRDEENHPFVKSLREQTVGKVFTIGEIRDMINATDAMKSVRDKKILWGIVSVGDALDLALSIFQDTEIDITFKVGDILDKFLSMGDLVANRDKKPFEGLTGRKILEKAHVYSLLDNMGEVKIDATFNVGKLIDSILSIKTLQNMRDEDLDLTMSIGQIIDLVGEQRVHDFLVQSTTTAMQVPEYERTSENIARYWRILFFYFLGFAAAACAVIAVELSFVKKDPRPATGFSADVTVAEDLIPDAPAKPEPPAEPEKKKPVRKKKTEDKQ